MCQDDHEEEIAQFDGEIVKKMIINDASNFLSTVKNLKVQPEGFWLGGNKNRVTRTDDVPNVVLSRSSTVPVPQIQEQRVDGASSSEEFDKLRKQAEIAERMAKEAGRMQTARRLWKCIKRSPTIDRVQ